MRKFKALLGGMGVASPGARERVSRSRTPLRLTRNRVATCRLEPSWFASACTIRRRQSREEGRRDCSVHVGFPYASVVVHASANRYPRPPRRAPDRRRPARTRRPGTRGGATARLPTWSVSPCQGCTHLMGRSSPNTRGGRGTGLRTRGVDGCGSPTPPGWDRRMKRRKECGASG